MGQRALDKSHVSVYCAVDALAARVRNLDLAARLRKISEYSLNAGTLPDAQQQCVIYPNPPNATPLR